MRRVEHPRREAVLEEDCLTAVLSPQFMPYCKAKKIIIVVITDSLPSNQKRNQRKE